MCRDSRLEELFTFFKTLLPCPEILYESQLDIVPQTVSFGSIVLIGRRSLVLCKAHKAASKDDKSHSYPSPSLSTRIRPLGRRSRWKTTKTKSSKA